MGNRKKNHTLAHRKLWPPCNPAGEGEKLKLTSTRTDRPQASRFYGEERDITLNEQALWRYKVGLVEFGRKGKKNNG